MWEALEALTVVDRIKLILIVGYLILLIWALKSIWNYFH